MELKAEEISKSYGHKQVVKGVSLSVKPGEIVGLLGPNGAGKTTTFYSLVGFLRPDSGAIKLDGVDVTGWPIHERARNGLGYLAQEPTVFRGLSVQDNLRLVLERIESSKKVQNERIEELLVEFGLWSHRDQAAWSLSGGEKRRLEVARAMICRPKILLLDEPFVGIDPITVSDLKTMITKLRAKGLGVLITDHNVRETLGIIERAYLIYDGKILVASDAKALLESEEARRLYLGEDFKI